jgi:cytochrome d ubiquinol oxidase subunit I
MTVLMIMGLIYSKRNTLQNHPLFLKCCTFAIPVPFIAAECGWILAEVGRQPWIVHYILPTFMGTSTLDAASLIASLALFVLFYAVLGGIELYLMFKFARLGPSSLGTGRYHLEGDKHA